MGAIRPTYHLHVTRDGADPGLIRVHLAKTWWGGPGVGGVSREILLDLLVATGDTEESLLAAVYRAVADLLLRPEP